MKSVRQSRIRSILGSEAIHSQEELVESLRARGVDATQSNVCRDLKELGVFKAGGVYQVPDADPPVGVRLENELPGLLRTAVPAGPHLLVLHTVVGGASRTALAIDRARWPEVVGTVAGDDCLFVATRGVGEQRRLLKRLAPYEQEK